MTSGLLNEYFPQNLSQVNLYYKHKEENPTIKKII